MHQSWLEDLVALLCFFWFICNIFYLAFFDICIIFVAIFTHIIFIFDVIHCKTIVADPYISNKLNNVYFSYIFYFSFFNSLRKTKTNKQKYQNLIFRL